MRNLYFYSGINPNKNEHTHVFFNDVANYLAYLNDYFVTSLDSDNYRINGGVVKSKGLLADYATITYIVEIEQDPLTGAFRYFKAYHVDKSEVVGGYSVFRLSVDLWASNMPYAVFRDIHVSRCNRNIGQGVYDEPKETRFDPLKFSQPMDDAPTPNSLTCLIVADAVVAKNITGNRQLQQKFIFAIDYKELSEKAGELDIKGMTGAEVAVRSASCIYAISGNGLSDFDIKVEQIFIVPSGVVSRLQQGYQLKFKDPLSPDATYTITGFFVKPDIYYLAKPCLASVIDIDYTYLVGCFGNATPLKRFTQDTILTFVFSISSEGVKISVNQGGQEYDVTASFEAPILGLATEKDALQTIGTYLSYIGGSLGTIGRLYGAYGNTSKTFGAVGGLIGEVGAELQKDVKAQSIGGRGDAIHSYTHGYDIDYTGIDYRLNTPFMYLLSKSTRDEKAHAYYEGASFDMYIDAFGDITNAPRLGYKKGDPLGDDTFIVADAEVIGVQAEAEAFIKAELMKGIYYLYV